MRSLVVAVLAMAACGQVNKTTDAGPPDMYVSDGAPTCKTTEMLCNNTCADLMTSEEYCGNCTTRCNALQACESGACVPADSCTRVREAKPDAGDGIYAGPANNTFYCDFAAGKQYEFGVGLFTSTFAGYVGMRATDFADAGVQKAFVAMYNGQYGVKTLGAWTPGYCCFYTTTGATMNFGGQVAFLFATTTTFGCGVTYSGTYPIGKTSSTTGVAVPPMPADYFMTNPVTENAGCAQSSNPAFFLKTTSF